MVKGKKVWKKRLGIAGAFVSGFFVGVPISFATLDGLNVHGHTARLVWTLVFSTTGAVSAALMTNATIP